MKLEVSKLSALLKEEIKNFDVKSKSYEVGKIISLADDVASLSGLEGAMLGELIELSEKSYGLVMNLSSSSVDVAILGNDPDLKEGALVKRTKRVLEVGVGEEYLGRIVNALNEPIDGKGAIKQEGTRPIEKLAPGVLPRRSVHTPLVTGIRAIDAMIPIGRGQRELIIGDRQSGKTSIATDAIIAQKKTGVKCIYCAIGQKNSSIAYLASYLKDKGAMDYTTIINASSSEAATMQYIAPYSAMALAEYFMDKGEDVLIIFDDLSKHAIAYRTLSLLLKRTPGREAYPGDIFYLHSRLLERACCLDEAHGGGTITALPIVETQEGDISAYIPTNVISITDGQIYLSNDLFNEGFRPAVDSGLSVSRVGSAAQSKAMKSVASSLKIELANYRENLSFAQFGSDLDSQTKAILAHGSVLTHALIQKEGAPEDTAKQVALLYCLQQHEFDHLEGERIPAILEEFYQYLCNLKADVLNGINSTGELTDEDKKTLIKAANQFKESYGY